MKWNNFHFIYGTYFIWALHQFSFILHENPSIFFHPSQWAFTYGKPFILSFNISFITAFISILASFFMTTTSYLPGHCFIPIRLLFHAKSHSCRRWFQSLTTNASYLPDDCFIPFWLLFHAKSHSCQHWFQSRFQSLMTTSSYLPGCCFIPVGSLFHARSHSCRCWFQSLTTTASYLHGRFIPFRLYFIHVVYTSK